MRNILLLILLFIGYNLSAQYTAIPDSYFEQALINLEIDSDGIINGQVLTSDIENIINLNLDALDWWIPMNISDLTGIQDFTSLEKLSINYTGITELDVSQNLQLKELDCSSNWLTSLDVSSNLLLEVLHIGNTGGDVGPWNEIEEIDLSNNPNIHTLYAYDIWNFKRINLKNGNNNSNMILNISIYPSYGVWEDPDYNPSDIYRTICIEVDNENLALNSQFPYSDWDITNYHTAYIFTEDMVQCSLGKKSFSPKNMSVYPNPVSDILYFDSDSVVQKVVLFDLTGRKILERNQLNSNSVDVSDLQKGTYILKIFSNGEIQTEKVIVK